MSDYYKITLTFEDDHGHQFTKRVLTKGPFPDLERSLVKRTKQAAEWLFLDIRNLRDPNRESAESKGPTKGPGISRDTRQHGGAGA